MPYQKKLSARSSTDPIEPVIRMIRGQRVILDLDLAGIYGVTTKRLNEQIRRNLKKFPSDFMFQLTKEEVADLNWSQNATKSSRRKGRPYLPLVFTEHGALMAANVLNSPRADEMSVFVVRAFLKMRAVLSENRELACKLVQLEKKLTERLDIHEVAIVDILRRIMQIIDPPPAPPVAPKPSIGFHV